MKVKMHIMQAMVAIAIALLATADLSRAAEPRPATRPATVNLDQLPLVSLPVGRSTVIQSAIPIKRVSVTDPKIADIQMITPLQVLISGKTIGTTDLILWDSSEDAHTVPVTVGVDQAALTADLANLLPNAKLDVRLSNNVVIVSGTLSHAAEAESLHRFLDISSLKYVDMTTLPGLRQVQLKVKVAEASRIAIRALAINTGFVDTRGSFGASNVGLNQFGLTLRNGFTFFGDKDPVSAVTLFGRAFIGSTTVESFIAALADNQYMRVLAEPTLVATSGQEASFLAGGEFPIPVVQGGTGLAANNSITIEYKEFGVRLHFRPTVLGDGKIHLHVAPEVSQLSGEGPGAVKLQGFDIPAILTRRAETTFELENGQTFAMAGLINQETQARSQRVPMLGDLPIIGALFRSVRYQQGDTELVIMVTASLVKPESMAADMPYPGMEHVAPNDWELYAVGRLHSKDSSNKISNSDAKWLKEVGLSKLHGPGAWTTYDTPPAEPQPDMQRH